MKDQRKRICIVTNDLMGAVRNGGVGTANTALAQVLERRGFVVHILYAAGNFEDTNRRELTKLYADQNIDLTILSRKDRINISFQPHPINKYHTVEFSYRVYLWLKDQPSFDIVHFNDYFGLGFFTAMAKATSPHFNATKIVTTSHGPTAWSAISNDAAFDDPSVLIRDALERGQIECSDCLIAPSKYMLDWLQRYEFRLPRKRICLPNALPREMLQHSTSNSQTTPRRKRHLQTSELVFFGRLETRKGIWQFLDALDWLNARRDVSDLTVTFMGKCPAVGDGFSKKILKLRSKNWKFKWQVKDDCNAPQALNYLKSGPRVAVVPSICDNSPCTIVELLNNAIPFITTNVGGIAELIKSSDRADVLTSPHWRALATKLDHVLEFGGATARPHQNIEKTHDRLAQFIDALPEARSNARSPGRQASTPAPACQETAPAGQPLVSICVLHHDRPNELRQCLQSIQDQGRDDIETLIYDNGTNDEATIGVIERLSDEFESANCRVIISDENNFPAIARNNVVEHAKGKYIIFIDEDNLLKENALNDYIYAIENSRFDIVVSCLDIFRNNGRTPQSDTESHKRQVFLGEYGVLGFVFNSLGDTNLIMRRSDFLKHGGFHDTLYFAPAEDWRFLAAMKHAGLRIGVAPTPLVFYRQEPKVWQKSWRKVNQHGARRQGFEGYWGELPLEQNLLLSYLQGSYWRQVFQSSNRRSGRPASMKIAPKWLGRSTKLQKLYLDPKRFFADSKYPWLRPIRHMFYPYRL